VRASVFIGTSLDGFIARANGDFDFLPAGGGEPHGYEEFMATVGRRSGVSAMTNVKYRVGSPGLLPIAGDFRRLRPPDHGRNEGLSARYMPTAAGSVVRREVAPGNAPTSRGRVRPQRSE
jgi:hypothetical protein